MSTVAVVAEPGDELARGSLVERPEPQALGVTELCDQRAPAPRRLR